MRQRRRDGNGVKGLDVRQGRTDRQMLQEEEVEEEEEEEEAKVLFSPPISILAVKDSSRPCGCTTCSCGDISHLCVCVCVWMLPY